MKTTSAVLAAAFIAVAVLPAASAAEKPSMTSDGDRPPLSIELTPGSGISQNAYYDRWEARSYATFSVTVTDTGTEDLDDVIAFVSVPREVEVTGFEGDGWNCWDTEGGVDCHNWHMVVPGEAWPTLTVRMSVREHMNEADSIDFYATTGQYGWAHAGVPFKTNTST